MKAIHRVNVCSGYVDMKLKINSMNYKRLTYGWALSFGMQLFLDDIVQVMKRSFQHFESELVIHLIKHEITVIHMINQKSTQVTNRISKL